MRAEAPRAARPPGRRRLSEAPLDPTRCPLCGDANACGAAAGRAECWCFDAKLAPEALSRIPARALGVACICAECGRGQPGAGQPRPGAGLTRP